MTQIDLPAELPGWVADHIQLYLDDPERAHLWDASVAGGRGLLPTLLLISTGRNSGKPRMLPLIYGKFDRGFAVVASKGGAPSHPSWYLNLLHQPECEIRVGAETFNATARTVTGAERERMWRRMAEIFPPYDDYQARTERQIPVVLLEPVG